MRKDIIAYLILLVFFLTTLVLITRLVSEPTNLSSKASTLKSPIASRAKSHGYLIELNENSVFDSLKKSSPNIRLNESHAQQAKNSEKTIKDFQEKAKKDISDRLGNKAFVGRKETQGNGIRILGEYQYALNAIALEITSSEAEKLKESPYVKSVRPNLEVKPSLMDSVPMIKAPDAWNMKDGSGQLVTGKNKVVSVIDSGVDYTRPDLGGTIIEERQYEKISAGLNYMYVNWDQQISLNQNRVAYPMLDKIAIYDLSTKTTSYVNLPTGSFYPCRIVLKDTTLFFFTGCGGYVSDITAYFVHDLATGETRKIEDVPLAGFIGDMGIGNDFVVYGFLNNGQPQATYIYDLKTGEKKTITGDKLGTLSPFVSGDWVAISHLRYEDTEPLLVDLHNVKTGEIKTYTYTSDEWYINAFNGEFLLTASHQPDNYNAPRYFLHDVTTGETLQLNPPFFGSTEPAKSTIKGAIWTQIYATKAFLGEGVIFFSKAFGGGQILAYDLKTKKYNQINLNLLAGDISGEENKICFPMEDLDIYCHRYDQNYTYPLSANVFNQKVIGGYNFINQDNNPFDELGHGTHVATIIASDGTLRGVAPDAKIIAYKVFGGLPFGLESDIIAAIERSVQTLFDGDTQNNVDVINMSLGSDCGGVYDDNCGPDDLVSKATDAAVDAGIVVVVAAGNSGENGNGSIGSPGTARKAISVGAVDKGKVLASFSSKGPVILGNETVNKPDLVAPGVGICAGKKALNLNTSCFDSSHIYLSGTSMATPHVAGIVALLRQAKPSANPEEIKNALRQSAEKLPDYSIDEQGFGLVNAIGAFQNLVGFRQAAEFNGAGTTGSLITIPQTPYLQMKGDMTIELWVKPYNQTISGPNAVNTFSLLAKESYKSGSSQISGYSFAIVQGKPMFTVNLTKKDGSIEKASIMSQTVLEANKWVYLKAVKNGNKITLFYNGKPTPAIVNTNGNTQQLPFSTVTVNSFAQETITTPLYFGCQKISGACFNRFYGQIDEVRISNIARSEEVVPVTPFSLDSNTIALWHLDQAFTDSSLNSLNGNGTNVNFTSSTIGN